MRLVRSLSLFALLACLGGSVLAEPEEDYQAGLKSHSVGDIVGAMSPLRRAALAGHAKAQALLAEILDRTDFDEDAVDLYRKAAAQGDPDGMFGLGTMIVSGEGVKKDPAAGRVWIQKAAELGHLQAINVMAQGYIKAELGISPAERDTPEALAWVKRAAANEYLPAIDALAAAYATGNGYGLAVDRALADQYQAQANRIRNVDPAKKKKQRRT